MGGYAAVILYFRLGETVRTTLDLLMSQDPSPVEVVLVDNASGDGVAEGLRRDYPDVRVLFAPENLGYSGGMAFGVNALTQDAGHVLLLTHEVRLEAGCMREMLACAAGPGTGGSVGMVGPVLIRTGTGAVWSTGGTLSRTGRVGHLVTGSQDRDVPWIDGACMLVSRDALDLCGLPDPRFFAYFEDVEYGLRMNDEFVVRVSGSARASQDTSLTPVYFEARNSLLLWRIRRDPVRWVAALARQLVKLALEAIPGPSSVRRARAAGIRDGFTGRVDLRHASVRKES